MILVLVTVAALEAAAMSWRIRSGVGSSRWSAAGAAAAMCLLRVVWMAAGVSAALNGQAVPAGTAYVLTAFLVTAATHRRA